MLEKTIIHDKFKELSTLSHLPQAVYKFQLTLKCSKAKPEIICKCEDYFTKKFSTLVNVNLILLNSPFDEGPFMYINHLGALDNIY